MFETIVWATDGSENAVRALPTVSALAHATGGRVVAVHCRELVLAPGGGFPVTVDDERVVDEIRAQLAGLAEEGLQTELHLARALAPHTAEAIADAARELGADAIVVGTRGHGPVAGLVAGSVAQRLLHVASCAIVAVPTRKRAEVGVQ